MLVMGLILTSCVEQADPVPAGPTGTAVNPNWESDINTTSTYLNALMEGQFDTASALVHDTFVSNGPAYSLTGDYNATVAFWTNNAQTFTNRSMPSVSYSVRVEESDNPDLVGDWVFHWGQFVGTVVHNNEQVIVPFHLTFKMVDGKIAEQNTYYDTLPIQEAMSR